MALMDVKNPFDSSAQPPEVSKYKAYDLRGIIFACFSFTINYTGGIMKIRLWHYANSHYLNLTLALFSNALYYPVMAL